MKPGQGVSPMFLTFAFLALLVGLTYLNRLEREN